MGTAATGTKFGSIVVPVMVQQLLPIVGFAWTVRSFGLVMPILGPAAAIGLRMRVPPRKGDVIANRSFL